MLNITCWSKREIGVLVLRLGGCTLEYWKGVEVFDRLHSKFLKVDGGKWVFMGVCVRDIWEYSDVKVE